MRRLLLASVSLFAFATGAVAADLPRAMPTKAPAYVPPALYNWTGFYLGVNGGYGWGRSHWSGFGTGADPSGGLVGATLGYNWQGLGSPWVFGLEGDIDWSDMRGSFANALCPTGCETRNTWLATVRGRVGYAWDRFMPYVTGGLALGDIKATEIGFGSIRDTRAGWTVGAGLEGALVGNLTAKVEYLHVDLGHASCDVVTCGLPTNVGFHADIVRGGLNYRF